MPPGVHSHTSSGITPAPSDRNHHTSTIFVGFCWGRRAVPLCRKQRQHSAPFGGDPGTCGGHCGVGMTPSMHLHSGVGVVFPLPPLSLTRRAPPGAGRDPLEEMFGVRMVDHESLFVVFFETFGSCDSQLDCFTALRGTDSLPTVLCVGGWRVVCRFACLLCKCSLFLGLGLFGEEITRLSHQG
ncbi:hypothetical protein PAPYR_9507 [Paratrimastix pyriformis]|uniref:Uncharacterized protein n=1 Tax=Paratrimastix pyriformis TaxID=342808 RepID=A0ABQ8U870_9EUKA|nr:hypothetical protein PAPYR_9507 [Paratrimastix pyriformis]